MSELTCGVAKSEQIEINERLFRIRRALKLNEHLIEFINQRRIELLEKRDENETKEFNDLIDDEEPLFCDNDDCVTRPRFVSVLPFFKPYFRDARGLSAPKICSNYFVKDLNKNLFLLLQEPHHNREWTSDENETLLREVRSQHICLHTMQLTNQLERLLETAPEEKSAELIAQINELNSELALASSKNLEPEPWSSTIDWLVIAKQLPPDRNIVDCELYYNNNLHKSISKKNWSTNEDQQLDELVKLHGSNNWDLISEKLGTSRLPWQCCARYQSELNNSMRRSGRIEGSEADEILKIIDQYKFGSFINWTNIACLIEGRTLPQIQHFYRKLQNPTVKRKWSRLEDRMILAGVKLFKNRWELISQFFPFRNNRQLRDRYQNQLSFPQERKLGEWTELEDNLIIEMSSKYIKDNRQDGTSVNIPKIQRLHFPNRNVYQVYRRFLYLKKMLGTSTEDENLTVQQHKVNMKARKTRKRFRTSSTALRSKTKCVLPDNEEMLTKFMIDGKNKLEILFGLMPSDAQQEIARKKLNFKRHSYLSKKETRLKPLLAATNQSTLVEEVETKCANQEFDQLLSSYIFLHSCRYKPKGNSLTGLDWNSNKLIELVFSETFDPAIERNLILPPEVLHVDDSNIPDYEESPKNSAELLSQISICSLDTIRFFLSNTVFAGLFTRAGAPQNVTSAHIKSLLSPNYSTLFGFSLLRLLLKALVIRLASLEPTEVEDFNEDQITEHFQFRELRLIFYSIFAWPALLASSSVAGDERNRLELSKHLISSNPSKYENNLKQAATVEVDNENDDSSHYAINLMAPKRRGRPKKRGFWQDKDRFVLLRSCQANLFLTNMRSDTIESLRNAYPFSESNYWLVESYELLRNRVKLFLEHIWRQVEIAMKEKQESKKRKK